MSVKAFTIDLDVDPAESDQDLGTMFILDATRVLTRPAVPGQYYRSPYNTDHSSMLLDLVYNDIDTPTRHLIVEQSPRDAASILDSILHAYVDQCCMELYCDAVVNFIVGDNVVTTNEYGMEDGSFTLTFNVYCGIMPCRMDELLQDLITARIGTDADNYLVLRPDPDAEDGFSAKGFIVGDE